MGNSDADANANIALISVWKKNGILELARVLCELNWTIVASGGTASYLQQNGVRVTQVQQLTGMPEILSGRVKTLHPAIHAGLLCRANNAEDDAEMVANRYSKIQLVVCNLYPFEETVKKSDVQLSDIIENIDIGGVTLLRAAAKNYERVTVACDSCDYNSIIDEISKYAYTHPSTREALAAKAFAYTAQYDTAVADFFRQKFRGNGIQQLNLKYGMNPHQTPAQLYTSQPHAHLPFKVINGSPSYINILDALNGWQLVREAKAALNAPAAASFKHVSPAGAAIGGPPSLTDHQIKVWQLQPSDKLSALATAYVRARQADRMSSYGDFIALSDTCDVSTAKIIAREVSDGVIAPDFDSEAIEILRKKKQGSYCILKMDGDVPYVPDPIENKNIFGLTLQQKRNDAVINSELLNNIKTSNKQLTDGAVRDLLLAAITCKYTQSNSVCLAYQGQVIGIGAGQQSRIHCVRLASDKADNWWLRQHSAVAELPFKKNITRVEATNAVESYISAAMSGKDEVTANWSQIFDRPPALLSEAQKTSWLSELRGVSLASDGFFPFRDNIDRAVRSGVSYIVCPSGSKNDQLVIEACDENNILLIHTNLRLFHH